MRYSLAETSTINISNNQIYIDVPREASVISLLISYLDINLEVIKKTFNSRHANGNDTKLVNLGPIALFRSFKITSSQGKRVEDISQALLVSLMYRTITTCKDSDDLSIGFDQSHNRRRDELAQNENIRGKYHVGSMLKDFFGFTGFQEKTTNGFLL